MILANVTQRKMDLLVEEARRLATGGGVCVSKDLNVGVQDTTDDV